mmetsp:Transcript_19179/g.50103  ORF Transcript_19179/g.50103 Transcript_19179/m.50103 type:complete len:328 (-) Transcript_19179:157-1140(-)|eukprot:jgi/Tetstr1/464275/TSEL_009078.t1
MASKAPSHPNQGKLIRDYYKLGKTLGTGGFSVVKLGTEKESGTEWAVKIMTLPKPGQKPTEEQNTREEIFYEIDILCHLKHPSVMGLKEYFEEEDKVYLVTELLTGGELLDAVIDCGNYTEEDARQVFVQMIKGIQYLHSKNIVHRDLKLENLLLSSKGDITTIKIADFGLAKRAMNGYMETVCGTPQYVAPEVIKPVPGVVYGSECDLWSCGVVLFTILAGYPPFYNENTPALFRQIRKGAYSFDDPVWDEISADAKDLIAKLLTVDPAARITSEGALQHPWCRQSLSRNKFLKGTQKNLKNHFRTKMKGAIGAIIAANKMKAMNL